MGFLVVQHLGHRLGKVLNAVVDRSVFRMVYQSIKHVGVEVSCGKYLGNMGFLHPREKVFFDVRTEVEGNIIEDHGLSGGFYYFCGEQFLSDKVRNPKWNTCLGPITMHKFIPSEEKNKVSRVLLGKIILVALHLVGAIGLSLPEYRELFLGLTPLHLLTTLVLILAYHRGWNEAFPVFAAAAFWIGFGSELIGIHTGYLYGDYVYGPTLGLKLWEVPLVIGVNWVILSYLTGSVFHKISNDWYAAFLAASAMTALDYILEPVAVALDFWAWKWEIIPMSNYLGWFGVSFLVQLIWRKANFDKYNPLATFLLITWILFFTLLNFTVVD